MKSNKKLKRIIMGGVGFAMAVVVFFVGSMRNMQEVAADVRVFDKITEKYPNSDKFKMNILEIVPTGTMVDNYTDTACSTSFRMNSASEIGYFLPLQTSQPQVPTAATYGGALGTPLKGREDPAYADVLYQLRTYGMIRPIGIDGSGEYPIYALKSNANGSALPVFANYETDTCKYAYNESFVKGVYSYGKGNYKLADGYALDENGTICKEVEVTVSDNTVSNNGTVSGNETKIELEPVDDIDMSKLSLPTSTSGFAYITYVEDGSGDLTFTRSEAVTQMTQYYGYSDQTLFYMKEDSACFFNSSYFREFVLGSRTKYANRNINYNVVQASAVTVKQVQDADLIYISGKDVTFAANSDISTEVLLEIYNQEVINHKAVMMDYASYGKNSDTNISKLAVLLWRESQTEIRSTYKDAYEEKSDVMKSVEFLKGAALKELKASMMTGANGNFVTSNVYVYNHHLSDFDDPKSLIDAGDMFANGDFNSAYTAAVMQNGFSEVLNYITATNKNSTTGSMLPSVTPAVAIQYILISDGKPLSIVKTSLNVLEIQPVTSFLFNDERGCEEYGYLEDNGKAKTNRENFVKDYLGNYYDDKVEYINFTSMTVEEFNGRNEDLIETYDIIYIGSETGSLYYTASMNTRALKDGVYDTTYTQLDLPSYQDENMYGMVYYNIGDKLNVVEGRLTKFLDKDTTEARFPGRDITTDKLNKLKLYLDAQKLVFVEGDLMSQTSKGYKEVNPTAVAADDTRAGKNDHGRIDDSSNMYEFMKYGLGSYFSPKSGKYENASTDDYYGECANLISVRDVDNGFVEKSTVEQYITTEKLTLTMLDQPNEYNYSLQENSPVMDPDTVTYMEENSNGTRQLEYKFMITSDIMNNPTASTYRPYLYIDVNNDGKYSTTSENIKDMQIVIAATGVEAERDGEDNYVLYKDVEYLMSRELDEAYNGYIKWKVSVQSNTYTNSHASVQGSTVVRNTGDDELLKILQITSPASTLDLEAQENDKNSLYGKYLAAVPGYKVEIKTMDLDEFAADFKAKWENYGATAPAGTKKSVEEYALDYFNSVEIVAPSSETADDGIYGANMLVLGFGDNFPSITYIPAITAIQSYMESERPVLLAHDFIMYWAYRDIWNGEHHHGRYLRNNVGMDKYGVTQNIGYETNSDDSQYVELYNAVTSGKGANYLHSGDNYTRSGNATEFGLIEGSGKAVAYEPGSCRGTILKTTQGLSNSVLMRWGAKAGNSWLNSPAAEVFNYHGGADYEIDKMNDGQITSYPYSLPDQFQVNGTHGQYFQLDMDIDDDDDGESDVVVWYTLGDVVKIGEAGYQGYNPWGKKVGGPMPSDGYYIYNKGNITYTGAGHANMANGTETEAQLFINTLFAAYNATNVEPSVSFYEEAPDANDPAINSVAVPYDENVTKGNTYDSSVLKDASGQYRYHFVNPNVDTGTTRLGTPMFFRLTDTNFVRGTKYMEIEYYLKAKGEAGDSFHVDDGSDDGVDRAVETLEYAGATVPVVKITDLMATYHVSNKAFTTLLGTGDLDFMESGVVYGFYLPLSYLNDNSQVTIYIKAKTRIYTKSSQTGEETVEVAPGEGVGELTVTKADLLDLD